MRLKLLQTQFDMKKLQKSFFGWALSEQIISELRQNFDFNKTKVTATISN